jgi:hypothetical protein
MAKFTVSAGGVPAGSYTATFAGVEDQPANAEKGYGPGIKWKFTILGPTQAGQEATRITSCSPTLKNAFGKMLVGLLGRQLQTGEVVDPDDYKGKKYIIMVGAGQNGGTRVEAVTPMPG